MKKTLQSNETLFGWFTKLEKLLGRDKKYFGHLFRISQAVNHMELDFTSEILPELLEWYYIDLSSVESLMILPTNVWNCHLKSINSEEIDMVVFYNQCHLIFLNPSEKELWQSSYGNLYLIEGNPWSEFSFSADCLRCLDMLEVQILYDLLDKFQILLSMRTRYRSYTTAFRDLANLQRYNFESLNPSTNIEILQTKGKFKIAWLIYQLCVEYELYFGFEGDWKFHFQKAYLWFLKTSQEIYKIIHPSRLCRLYTFPNISGLKIFLKEQILIYRLEAMLHVFYSLKFLGFSQELVDSFCLPKEEHILFRDLELRYFVKDGLFTRLNHNIQLYARYRKYVYNIMTELQYKRIHSVHDYGKLFSYKSIRFGFLNIKMSFKGATGTSQTLFASCLPNAEPVDSQRDISWTLNDYLRTNHKFENLQKSDISLSDEKFFQTIKYWRFISIRLCVFQTDVVFSTKKETLDYFLKMSNYFRARRKEWGCTLDSPFPRRIGDGKLDVRFVRIEFRFYRYFL